MANALTRKAQHTLNTVVITQLNLLGRLENLDVQLVSYGQTTKNINGYKSFEFETVVLRNLGQHLHLHGTPSE